MVRRILFALFMALLLLETATAYHLGGYRAVAMDRYQLNVEYPYTYVPTKPITIMSYDYRPSTQSLMRERFLESVSTQPQSRFLRGPPTRETAVFYGKQLRTTYWAKTPSK